MQAAKILLYDVETSPCVGYTWGKWEQDVIQFISERKVISFAWKWLGDKKISVLSLPDFPGYSKDPNSNRELVSRLHDLFLSADVVVGHNVLAFDDRVANTDFLLNGFPPPPPHKVVDTLKVLRSKFSFSSNKLEDACLRLNIGSKVKHGGFSTWLGCLRGEKKSWRLMKKYNSRDVVLLEKLYLRIRPWMSNHPPMSFLDKKNPICPTCQSSRIQKRGFSLSAAYRCRRFQCSGCGAWFRGRAKMRTA